MRLYRGLTRPFRPDRVAVPFQPGTPAGTNGTDFTECPLAALGYARGRRGVVLVIDLPEPLPRWVSEEYWGDSVARRLMLWRPFHEYLVAEIPAQELRAVVRRKGVAATSDDYKSHLLERHIEQRLTSSR
ncbi:MAG: hypothetical protein AB1714_09850 [Acidobacteriota bacterium]